MPLYRLAARHLLVRLGCGYVTSGGVSSPAHRFIQHAIKTKSGPVLANYAVYRLIVVIFSPLAPGASVITAPTRWGARSR